MSSIKQDHAFFLKLFPFSNTSLILHLFTRNHGKQSFIIKGAYKQTSKYPPAYFSLFCKMNISFYQKENRNLHVLKEIYPLQLFDISSKKLQEKILINVFAELIDTALSYQGLPNQELFFLLETYLHKVDSFLTHKDFHYYYWTKLLSTLGIQPLLIPNPKEFVKLNIPKGYFYKSLPPSYPDTYLHRLLHKKQYEIPEPERRKAIYLLWKYYEYHIPNFQIPKSFLLYEKLFPVPKTKL